MRVTIPFRIIGMILLAGFSLSAQEVTTAQADPGAVALLDKMAASIGDLESCSFTVHTTQDDYVHDYGLITRHASHKVYFKGPDKMQVSSEQYNGKKGIWYNGDGLWYYSFTQNNYSLLPIQGNLIEVFDTLQMNYGVELPAADIFYPAFTDDVLQAFAECRFVGEVMVEGVECYQIIARKEGMLLQIWLRNDPFFLPVKYSITQEAPHGEVRYTAVFQDWLLNPQLPESMFDFQPPASAREITMIPKKQ